MRAAIIVAGLAAILDFGAPWSCIEGVEPLTDPNAPTQAPVAPSASVRVDVQMVSISVTDARVLVPEFQSTQKANAAWARLQEMIAHGQAELLAWPVVWLRTGDDASSRSELEERYPTEYTPPQFPQTFSINLPPSPPTPKWGSNTPTAFETRNTGAMIDVTAMKAARDGADVELSVATEFARRVRTREWRIQRSPLGVEGVATQPDFQTSKVTTALWVHRGEPLLIGVFLQSEPAPHAELHILHARATLLPPGASNPPLK
jgi:hypothetical protein